MKTKQVKIDKLKEWSKNPRNITKKGFLRLRKQILKLGQYKPLIVDTEMTVLGGNMRLKALRDTGTKEVWVSIVNPKNDTERMEYALSDNDQAGFYDTDGFFNLLPELNLPELEDYGINFKGVMTLKQFKAMLEKDVPEPKTDPTKDVIQRLLRGYEKYLKGLTSEQLIYEDKFALWK